MRNAKIGPTSGPLAQHSGPSAQTLWTRALDNARARLGPERFTLATNIGTFEELQTELEKLKSVHEQKALPKLFERLTPFLTNIESFSKAITTCTQAGSPVAPLVWGTLQTILVTATRYTGLLIKITDMLEKMSYRMPRFELYRSLFGKNDRVERLLADFYTHYITFCVETIRYLSRNRMYAFIKLSWGREVHLFSETMNNIDICKQEIEDEAKAANFELDNERHGELLSNHDEIVFLLSASRPQAVQHLRLPCRHIPFSRNPKFFPRPEYLSQIEQHLAPSLSQDAKRQHQLRSFVLHGLGGVGKTQIALHYAYQHWEDYDAILWASADSSARLDEDFAYLAKKLGVSESSNQVDARIALRAWLKDTSSTWLLVLDNADEPDILPEYWPQSAKGSILITSRSPSLEHGVTTGSCTVEPMATSDGSSMLMSLLRPANPSDTYREEADEICDELGGLPLAISQMSGYMLETRCSLRQFLTVYRQRQNDVVLLSSKSSLHMFQYNHTLESVWKLSLSTLGPQARDFICICAFLDPDAIPEQLFRDGVCGSPDMDDFNSLVRFNEVIQSLLRSSLVKRNSEDSILSLHRLVQRNALLALNTQSMDSIFLKATWLLYHVFPRQSPIGEPIPDWPSCERYRKHVTALHRGYVEFIEGKAERPVLKLLTELFCDCGVYLWARGLFAQSAELAKTSIKIADAILDSYDTLRAQPYTLLGCIHLRIDGKSGDAVTCLETALKIREEHRRIFYGSSRPPIEVDIQLANAYNNLGLALQGIGRLEYAAELHGKSIEIKQLWPKHQMGWLLALSYHNLGKVRQLQGDLDKAASSLQSGLSLKTPEDERTQHRKAGFMYSLGCIEIERGNLEGAKSILFDALRIQQKTVGDNVDTGLTCYRLGILLDSEGILEEARLLLQRSIDIFQKPDYYSGTKLARSVYRMSLLLRKLNCQEESIKFQQQATVLYNNLIGTSANLGPFEEAQNIFENLVTE